ncbi:MAG TPA: signal recognition particle receptor subunit alpha, partial [Blastocatellia bacterium]|nr:signal recognition particle receptor subunit alpha [Blastocatellia bacterium]
DTLSEKLEQTAKKLRGLGKITERNVEDAVRDVRLALLEADVHFQVVKDFTDRVRALATQARSGLRSSGARMAPKSRLKRILRPQQKLPKTSLC